MKTRLFVLIAMGLSISLLSQTSISPINVSVTQPVCVVAGINDLNFSDQFKIYPSPFHETLKIERIKNKAGKVNSVTITNILGAVVMELEQVNQKNEPVFEINVSELETGFYIIILQSDTNLVLKQKIIKH